METRTRTSTKYFSFNGRLDKRGVFLSETVETYVIPGETNGSNNHPLFPRDGR